MKARQDAECKDWESSSSQPAAHLAEITHAPLSGLFAAGQQWVSDSKQAPV